MPSDKLPFLSLPEADTRVDTLRRQILTPVAELTLPILVHLTPLWLLRLPTFPHTVRAVSSAEDGRLLQHTLLLALRLYNHRHRSLSREEGTDSCTNCLILRGSGVNSNTLLTPPTNHRFYLCLARRFHRRS